VDIDGDLSNSRAISPNGYNRNGLVSETSQVSESDPLHEALTDYIPAPDMDINGNGGGKIPTMTRVRRYSTTSLSPQDEKLISTLLEKIEGISTILPGVESLPTFHRKWVPLTVSSKNTFVQGWIDYMTNPLLTTPVTIPPEVAELPDNVLIWRMTVNFMRKLLAEFIGSFVMTFWAGAIRTLVLAGNTDLTGVTLEIAGMAIGILYATAHFSGGHLNTAVTWMFALKGIFPWKWAPLFFSVQLIGGILAGGFILAFFGSYGSNSVNDFGPSTIPDYEVTATKAMFMEALTWWFLGFVVLMCLKNVKQVGLVFPLIVGWSLITIGQINGVYTGWSSNPIRTLGPCIVFGNCRNEWIYFGGPMIGATCSIITAWLLDHKNREHECQAACGGPVTPIY